MWCRLWLWFLKVLVHLPTSNNSLKMVQQCGGASGWHFLGEMRWDSCICSCFCFGCYIVSAKSSILVWVPEPLLFVSLWVCRLLCVFMLWFSWGSVAASLFGFSRCICICASLSSLFWAVCFCVDIDPWVGWVPYLFSFWLFEYFLCVLCFRSWKGSAKGQELRHKTPLFEPIFTKCEWRRNAILSVCKYTGIQTIITENANNGPRALPQKRSALFGGWFCTAKQMFFWARPPMQWLRFHCCHLHFGLVLFVFVFCGSSSEVMPCDSTSV